MNLELSIIELAAGLVFGIIAFSMLLAFIRLIIGPTAPDRVLALDLIASLTIGISIALMFLSKQTMYLDIAVFIALIVFIGTVAISKFLKRRIYDQ
jgi:multicomponent Na+:H+ antiporter subunit F